MDNITHGLLGLAIGMARTPDGGHSGDSPPSATDRAVILASFIAAELPDIDIFFGKGPMDQYIYHRGLTHAFVVAPLIALVAMGVAKLIWRGARARTVYGWSLAAVLIAHLVNDWMTGWGTRILLPFSESRLGLDWVPIVDLLYTLPLLVGVLVAWRRPALRQRSVRAALLYLAIYTLGYRAPAHFLAERAVAQQYAGAPVQRMQISPDLFNPVKWQYTVALDGRYEQGTVYPLGAPRHVATTPIPPDDAVTRAVRSAPDVKPFFDQFAYPLVTYQRTPTGYAAVLSDVRYIIAGRGMTYTVQLSPDLKVTAVTSGS